MIQLFRKFFSSKLGIVMTLAFLGLIAFAFASMDISSSGTFGGIAGGDRVAVVGDERIDSSELSMNLTNALDTARQTDPTITMEAFIADGGLEDVLAQMIDRTALAEFARSHGMRAGDRLVDSELLQIAAFRGADGKFDRNAFLGALGQRGLSEAAVREDLAMGLLARQLLTPVSAAPVLPVTVGRQYASLLRERREGAIALLPSTAFAPTRAPTTAQLEAFYQANREDYIRPERRVIRYASFGDEALGDLTAPTAAQIAERYKRDRAQYAARKASPPRKWARSPGPSSRRPPPRRRRRRRSPLRKARLPSRPAAASAGTCCGSMQLIGNRPARSNRCAVRSRPRSLKSSAVPRSPT